VSASVLKYNAQDIASLKLTFPSRGTWTASLTYAEFVPVPALPKGTLSIINVGNPLYTLNLLGDEINRSHNGAYVTVDLVGAKWVTQKTVAPLTFPAGTTVGTIVTALVAQGAGIVYPASNPAITAFPTNGWTIPAGAVIGKEVTKLVDLVPNATWRIDPLTQGCDMQVDLYIPNPTVAANTPFPPFDTVPPYLPLGCYGIRETGGSTITLEAPGVHPQWMPGWKFLGHNGGIPGEVLTMDINETTFISNKKSQCVIIKADDDMRSASDNAEKYDLNSTWSGTIAAQTGQLCTVIPDAFEIFGTLTLVPISLGIPGTVQVTPGTRCTFTFSGADSQKPIVTGFSNGLTLTLLTVGLGVGGLGAGFVAIADGVAAELALIKAQLTAYASAFDTHTHLSAAPTSPTGTPTASVPPISQTALDTYTPNPVSFTSKKLKSD